ncbi:unnamed protein product [Lactuca saligna]|uniref:Uncharacterized protein n=1 Tax=Lactuca saligna TaxID=75948 RepID=A0AA35ZNP1_LACSI|nr:unnamed protein product [Lactuca saligna]
MEISEKKSKKSKIADVGSLDTKVKSSKKTKQTNKMKSKSKQRSSGTNVVRKTQVSHQGLIFREIHAPASPSSKKRMATDMAKHISKKKQRKLVLSSDSTADEIEVILETPEKVLINESSNADTSVT